MKNTANTRCHAQCCTYRYVGSYMLHNHRLSHPDMVPEWLRGTPAKCIGSASAGSNPVHVGIFLFLPSQEQSYCGLLSSTTLSCNLAPCIGIVLGHAKTFLPRSCGFSPSVLLSATTLSCKWRHASCSDTPKRFCQDLVAFHVSVACVAQSNKHRHKHHKSTWYLVCCTARRAESSKRGAPPGQAGMVAAPWDTHRSSCAQRY